MCCQDLKLIAELEEAKSGIKLSEQTIVRLRKEKETNLEAINRIYMDTKRAEARVAECTDQIRTLSIDRTNLAMDIAAAKAQLEKLESEIRQHGEDTEGAREKLFTLLHDLKRRRGSVPKSFTSRIGILRGAGCAQQNSSA